MSKRARGRSSTAPRPYLTRARLSHDEANAALKVPACAPRDPHASACAGWPVPVGVADRRGGLRHRRNRERPPRSAGSRAAGSDRDRGGEDRGHRASDDHRGRTDAREPRRQPPRHRRAIRARQACRPRGRNGRVRVLRARGNPSRLLGVRGRRDREAGRVQPRRRGHNLPRGTAPALPGARRRLPASGW